MKILPLGVFLGARQNLSRGSDDGGSAYDRIHVDTPNSSMASLQIEPIELIFGERFLGKKRDLSAEFRRGMI
jgi:hypothetical protein